MMRGTVRHPLPLLTLCAALMASGGLIGCEEPAEPPEEMVVLPDLPTPEQLAGPVCDPEAPLDPGDSLPRRLTNAEYRNSVEDLFGVELGDEVVFPPEEEMLGFDNNARALQLTPVHAERYMEAAENIVGRVLPRIEGVAPCDRAAESERACAARFIDEFGARVWRRPLTDRERARLLQLYDAGLGLEDGAYGTGIGLVLEAMLQSPNFLFRIEVGQPDAERPHLRRLNDYELASRLSYLIWRTTPDAELLAAAAAGELSSPEQLNAQAERLLADPRAREAWWTFFAQWLHLDEVDDLVRDPRFYPQFGINERSYMARSARDLVEQIIWESGDLRGLFNAEWTHPDDPPTADARTGLLAHPAVLAVTSTPTVTNPVYRGVFVREQILCTALPPPPPGLAVVAPDPDPRLTTREQFAEHAANPACSGCHALMDPIGFGFEHYDAIGQWRLTQNGHDVDARGELTATHDANGEFYGVAELSRALGGSEQVQRCVAIQVVRYGMGRNESQADACLLDALYTQAEAADFDFASMVRALVTHDAFRYIREDDA